MIGSTSALACGVCWPIFDRSRPDPLKSPSILARVNYMNSIIFYIGLGIGLAAACGLRPFLPVLLAGVLASSSALGVSFADAPFRFLMAGWWLAIVAVTLILAYVLQLRVHLAPIIDPSDRSRRNDPLGASLTGLAFGAGALLFGGTLAAHGDSAWPGLLGGLLVVGIAQRASGPIILGARARLPDRGAREALTLYLDGVALLLAALTALLHPLGYVLLALLVWFLVRTRRRAGEKYAGLRILRR
jgi:hypothetical protein